MDTGRSGGRPIRRQIAGIAYRRHMQELRNHTERADVAQRRSRSLFDILFACDGGPEYRVRGRVRVHGCSHCHELEESTAMQTSYPSTSSFTQPAYLDMLLDMPPVSLECLMKHAWNPEDCSPHIYVKDDKLTFHKNPTQSTDSIRGKVGFTQGLHIWEVHWVRYEELERAIVGVATQDAPLRTYCFQSLNDNNEQSWGWDMLHNELYHGLKKNVSVTYPSLTKPGETFSVPNKCLVVLDMNVGTLSFIVNGQYLGIAFHGLCGRKLYPIVRATCGFCEVTMKYIGGLYQPKPLVYLCRHEITKRVGKHQLKEHISQFNLPDTLQNYLLNNDQK